MTTDIVLIGPMGAGKSTVGTLLAGRLGVSHHAMDDRRWAYYAEVGYDDTLCERIHADEGLWGVFRYWRPYELHAVERLLGEHAECRQGCVIDMGAGHSVYEDDAHFARAAGAMSPFTVVLLLPSPDEEDSIRILNERTGLTGDQAEMNAFFVRHRSNRDLATNTVYTGERRPDEVCDEVVRILNR
jgi:shikimate kinase